MRPLLYLIFVGTLCSLTGCASMKPAAFAANTTTFEPEKFFTGFTSSTGVMENRRGNPVRRITTETEGVMKDGILHIEQDLAPEGRRKTHRSWQMRRIDANHVDATANDIVGTAHGVLHGNVLHWSFQLALSPTNPLMRVRMTQWMYLQPGGQTLIIRTVIRKTGVQVVQITEQFNKR